MTSKLLKPEARLSSSLTDEAHQTFPDGLSFGPAHEDLLVPTRCSLDHGDLRACYPEEPRQVIFSTSALALPPVGGAATEIFKAPSPYSPLSAVLFAPGETRSFR